MTCIVAIKSKNVIYMGGDSFSGNSSYSLHLRTSKIVRKEIGEEIALFGSSGSHRGAYLLRTLEWPPLDFDHGLSDWVGTVFVDALRGHLKKSGFLRVNDEVEEYPNRNSFILGIGGKIFSIWDDFSTVETEDPYMAIGAGMYFALGALHVLCAQDKSPRDSIELALKAAERHNPFVSGPFHIISSLP